MKSFSSYSFFRLGFTLIELLVVVLILGLLASVALPYYGKAVERSRMAEVETLFGNVRRSQALHLMNTGRYTTNWQRLAFATDNRASASDLYCLPGAADSEGICTAGETKWSLRLCSGGEHGDGVEAVRKGSDYGEYALYVYYKEGNHTVYCQAADGSEKSQGLCADFTGKDVYEEPALPSPCSSSVEEPDSEPDPEPEPEPDPEPEPEPEPDPNPNPEPDNDLVSVEDGCHILVGGVALGDCQTYTYKDGTVAEYGEGPVGEYIQVTDPDGGQMNMAYGKDGEIQGFTCSTQACKDANHGMPVVCLGLTCNMYEDLIPPRDSFEDF